MTRTWLMASVLLATLLAPGLLANTPAPETAPGNDKETHGQRLREGEVIEAIGTLELVGDGATFRPREGQVTLRVLENLALERVARVLGESRDEREWIISGTVTEYRGANYILIQKAIQRPRKPVAVK